MQKSMRKILTIFSMFFLCLILQSCATAEKKQPESDLVGLRGHVSAKAEQAFSKGNVLWRGGVTCTNPELAYGYFDEALEAEPKYAEALLWRGILSLQMEYLDDALDDVTEALVSAKKPFPYDLAYAIRSIVLQKLGHPAGAQKDMIKAEAAGLSSQTKAFLAHYPEAQKTMPQKDNLPKNNSSGKESKEQ